MSPTPKRQPGWTCGCGSWNESFRTHCRNCQTAARTIVPFEFPATGQPVRTVTVDSQPWFVAKDICAVLGIGNPSDAVRSLDDDEYRLVPAALVSSEGRPQDTINLVNEPGLYSLILRSRKPEAKAFKRWITHDVLPAIRQTGKYEARPALPQTHAEALRALADEVEQHEKTRQALAEAKPKAHSWDVLASGKGDYSVADAAKILSRDPSIDTGRDRLFTYMETCLWVYRQRADGRWRAYQQQIGLDRLSELPQQYENPKTGEVTLGAPQVRIKAKGLRELHKRLGGTAELDLTEVDA